MKHVFEVTLFLLGVVVGIWLSCIAIIDTTVNLTPPAEIATLGAPEGETPPSQFSIFYADSGWWFFRVDGIVSKDGGNEEFVPPSTPDEITVRLQTRDTRNWVAEWKPLQR